MRHRIADSLTFFRRVWRLGAPYWRSEERWPARGLLATIVILTVGLVFLLVLLNNWNREFYEAIQNKDFASFGPLLLQFAVLATIYIIGAVYKLYFTQMLQMRWRVWMTRRFVNQWLNNQVYYRLELRDRRTDNPDQRIAEDVRAFTFNTLDLSLGLLGSLLTLVSFLTILWVLSGPLSFALAGVDLQIPGYMVWVAIVYAAIGSYFTAVVGRRLIPVNFQRQRLEADFRFGLVRLRENSEGVALYHGEPSEQADLMTRFERIRANWWDLMRYTKRLTFLVTGYDQVANIFPILVAAPRYFAGEISLGVLLQLAQAFGQVQGSLSWFIEAYSDLAVWKASVDRLLTFDSAMREAELDLQRAERIEVSTNGATQLRAENLDLMLPNGRSVLGIADFSVSRGDKVLVTGPTGVGKSTLFRALAGIWPFGSGNIEVPSEGRQLFLPQKPYIPIATLREAASYPAAPGTFSDDEIRDVLTAAHLEAFVPRLEEVHNWSMVMSGGEQQRLALARALLHKPDWLFMDEATAALDEPSEQALYHLLQERLPNATIISIAHRPRVADFHARTVALPTNPTLEASSPTSIGARSGSTKA
jgi:vitamin B12/bleomycin/antimicrobial peptide transport system ATP-binding/permease protein